MFTLTQWLQLASIVVLPCAASWLVTKGAGAIVDRESRRYRQIDKVLELESQ
jgi:hypothetical protein